MNANDLLTFARGTLLQYAVIIFIVGMLIRLLEIWLIGRKKDLSEPRASGTVPGLRTIVTRSIPAKGLLAQSIAGYVFHVGLFVIVFFFVPHILFFKGLTSLQWPGLPNAIIDAVTIATLAALVYAVVVRVTDPVRRMLSNFNDYFSWLITLLPVITGYLAFHRHVGNYTLMLAIHIITVDLFLIFLPFTKLTHAMTFLFARWYSGAMAGRKGVKV